MSGTLNDTSLIYVQGATAVAANGTLVVTSGGGTANFATTQTGALAVTFDATGHAEVLSSAGLAALVSGASSQTVSTSAGLAAAIRLDDQAADALASVGQAGAFAISLGSSITLATRLDAINLPSGSSLTIDGQGNTLDGGGAYNGLFVYAGTASIENLTIAHATAAGGSGGPAGGGGAGLGGGLFVGANVAGNAGVVTLTGVTFSNDKAVGGNGGGVGSGGGGGGLLGGAGGDGRSTDSGGGGGGGGIGGAGGIFDGGNGAAGLVPGAAGGGKGSPAFIVTSGGASGGGGGGTGGTSFGGGGGGGGGGGLAPSARVSSGSGGFGGGGGGNPAFLGGHGGFGGGGGSGQGPDAGGFGGGDGGGARASNGRRGLTGSNGFGGGTGAPAGGGGGLGAGGDIFVQAGASLTLSGTGSLSGGSVAGGQAGPGAGGGGAFGPGIYFQGTNTLTFATTGTQTIADVISDNGSSKVTADGAGDYAIDVSAAPPGSAGLVVDGAGRVILSGSNTYTGGTTIKAGTLELAADLAAGFGTVSFAGQPASLVVDAGASLVRGIFLPPQGGNRPPVLGGTAVGVGGIGDSVINSGTIQAGIINLLGGFSDVVGGVGVALGAGETLNNTSTGLIIGGEGGGIVGGVTMTGGNAINAGTIKGSDGLGFNPHGGGNGANEPAGRGGPGVFMSGGTLSNTGLVAGGAGSNTNDGGVGVNLSGPALLTNSGTVKGGRGLLVPGPVGFTICTAGDAGVQIMGGATTVNLSTGSIVGGAGLGDPLYYYYGGTGDPNIGGPTAAYGKGNAAVYLDGGTLDTAGTITGGSIAGNGLGDAVYIVGNTDRVIVRPGAVFNGYVVATGTADVLELGAPATGHAAGVLSGVGTGVIGFSTIAFDAGASWTLSGSAAGFGAVHAVTGFAAASANTIDVTGVGLETGAALGAGNLLTLSGGGAPATIALDPSANYAGDAFLLAADGAGGTDVTVVAAAPVIGGTAAGQATTDEKPLVPFSAVTITDTGPSDTATVTYTAANGTLADPNAATDGSTAGAGTYTVTGSAAQVQADLRALVFTPTAHEVAPGQAVTTGFALSVADGALSAADATTTVVATAVNDPPMISGTTAGLTTLDTAALKPFTGVTITDPDLGAQDSLTITLIGNNNGVVGAGAGKLIASDANGVLSGAGLTKTGVGTYALAATTPGALTAALDALSFTPTVHEVSPGQRVNTGFTLVAAQGSAATTDTTTSVNVTAVGVASTLSGAQAGQATTDEAAIKPFAAIAIADPNGGGPTETVTVTPGSMANGTLADPNAATDGSTLSGGTYTVSGTAAQVQADLRGLVFTPKAHEVAPSQAVTTGFTISDTNSAGLTASNATTTVVATAVNDPPAITGTKAGQVTTDYVALKPFTGVAVTDPDVGAQDSLAITVETGSGTATDANGILSGTGLTKTGTGTYKLAAATPASLSAAVDALTFTPAQGEVAAGQTVTTRFALAASQNGATTTDSSTTVTATALDYVNGPAGGGAVLNGTPGVDVITAHGTYNAIFGNGGADIINAGDGAAYVDVAGASASVTLGGSFNAVTGGDGNVTVKGAPDGYTAVTLGNGNNVVQVGGQYDYIQLGNGNNLVSGTQGMAFITTGSGNDTIKLGGSGSTVNAGAGTNSITGGSGHDSFVLPKASQGFDSIVGFTEANGDVLDLRAALAATNWNHKAATLGNYLKVSDSGGSATLLVAPTGSGGGAAVATLTGAGNLGLADLLSHHALLTG